MVMGLLGFFRWGFGGSGEEGVGGGGHCRGVLALYRGRAVGEKEVCF